MGVIKKDVPIRLGGLVTIPVTIVSAVDKTADRGNHHYCTGTDDRTHEPTRINQEQFCPAVGQPSRKRKNRLPVGERCERTGYQWQKGQENDAGEVVLFTKEELDALHDPTVKEAMVLSAHPLDQVLAATVPGEHVYYLQPAKPAAADSYAGLADLLRRHPDLALLAVFATRTKANIWRLQLLGDVITLQSLAWPEDLHAAPAVPVPLESTEVRKLADMALASITSEFDADQYTNQARVRREELLTSKTGVAAVPMRPVTFLDQLRAETGRQRSRARSA